MNPIEEPTDGYLRRYFADRDSSDPDGALDMLSSDVRYHLMPKPGIEIVGTGRASLRSQLSALPSEQIGHQVLWAASNGALEFVVGNRTTGDDVLGTFAAVALVRRGELSAYFGTYFDGSILSTSPIR